MDQVVVENDLSCGKKMDMVAATKCNSSGRRFLRMMDGIQAWKAAFLISVCLSG